MVPANPPDPTPEYEALTPTAGESPLDALARVGDSLVGAVAPADQAPDTSRKPTKLPRQIACLVALRAQGYDNHEIAEKLKVSPRKLKALIAKARRVYGWSDLGQQIADYAAVKAVSNLGVHLDYEGTKTAVKKGHHAMTRRTLDGTGLFRSHSAVKHESKHEETNILRVEIVLPAALPAVADGSVLATPRRALPDIPTTAETVS